MQILWKWTFDVLRLWQNGRQFEEIFKSIFFKEKLDMLIEISLIFITKGPIDYNSSLVQLVA